MTKFFQLALIIASMNALTSVTGTRILDFSGGQAASVLGSVELEGQELGDKLPNDGSQGNNVFIKNEQDSSLHVPSLHFKREAHYRRAEVKALNGKTQAGKTYYIGYKVRLSKIRDSLVIFQWKKQDKDALPIQNIPFHLEFNSAKKLTLAYTVPNGSRTPRWTGNFSVTDLHQIGLAFSTATDGSGWLELWIDGKQQTFDNGSKRLTGLYLFTGPTHPKFGIYRGEKPLLGGSGPDSDYVFNSWIQRVQISDASWSEVRDAAGVN